MSNDSSNTGRLRPHPEDRFSEAQISVNLADIAAKLRSEPETGVRGHRQETLYKSAGTTIALFAFDKFTHLPEHRAKGVVSIQILRGRFKVTVAGKVHELHAGQMLILSAGVSHAVASEEEGELLVTVSLVEG